MALRKRPLAAGIAAFVFSGYLSALGLGDIRLNSALNEPLDAEVPLINLGELSEDEIIAGLASADDFENARVDRELIHSSFDFTLDLNRPGGPVLRITSQKPIRAPYLDFLVDLQWPSGRVLREYTLLLDLPVYAGGTFTGNQVNAPATSANTRRVEQAVRQAASQRQDSVSAGEGEYVVRSGDTLWRIASSLPGSATVYDKMADLQQLNPDAFINGNINLLKRGAVLRLPAYGSAAGGRTQPDMVASGETALSAPAAGRSTAGGPSYREEDGGGRLRLAAENREEGGTGGRDGLGMSPLRSELDSIQDELARSQRENADLKERLASLENQLVTMQRLLQLEDDELRAAQLAQLGGGEAEQPGREQSLGESGFGFEPDPDREEDYEPEESPNLALFPSANTRLAKPDASGGDGNPTGQEGGAAAGDALDAQPEANSVAGVSTGAVTTESAEPGDAKPAKMVLNTEKGWVDKVSGYLAYILGALVVILGAAAVIVWRRNRASEQDDDVSPTFAQPYNAPPLAKPAAPEPEYRRPPPAASLDDIDLKGDDDLFAPEEAQRAPAADRGRVAGEPASPEEIELDLSEFDLEDHDDEIEPPEAGSAAPENLDLDDEFDFLGDTDEGDTQLELAQAYIEMGDNVGAREILNEVAEAGNDEQKAKAQALLDQIG